MSINNDNPYRERDSAAIETKLRARIAELEHRASRPSTSWCVQRDTDGVWSFAAVMFAIAWLIGFTIIGVGWVTMGTNPSVIRGFTLVAVLAAMWAGVFVRRVSISPK